MSNTIMPGSLCRDILGSSECTYTNQRCVGKGVSFKRCHDLNSKRRIKIRQTEAAMKAGIKCAQLNAGQFLTYR